jgi:hypothetical protein
MQTAAIEEDLNWIPRVVDEESFAMAFAVVITCYKHFHFNNIKISTNAYWIEHAPYGPAPLIDLPPQKRPLMLWILCPF